MLKIGIIIALIVIIKSESCPNKELLHPCVCNDRDIICGGKEDLNLKNIFKSFSLTLNENKKSFNTFKLNNTAIKRIESNTFLDITFNYIFIEHVDSLERIHTNAFSSCTHTLKEFRFQDYSIESATNELIVIDLPDYKIFEMLSSFVNLETFVFLTKLMTSIPDNAFQPINGVQNKLSAIAFCCRNTLSTIGKHPFYELNQLSYLGLYQQNISHIKFDAFWFKNQSTQILYLDLVHNQLNGSSFEIGAFLNAKRPIYINLSVNRIDYLNEKVFSPFFASHVNNTIYLGFNPMNCSDCRNKWIISDNLKSNLFDAKCNGDGKSIFDPTIRIGLNHCSD